MSDLKCAACAVAVTMIQDLTREKSAATSDLICAHREIERNRSEILRLDVELAKLRATLAQPHMEWAAGQHSVGVDIESEDRRLRARLALVEPVYEAAKAWRQGRVRSLIGTAPPGGGSWSRKQRPRVDTHPLQGKLRWEAA